MFTGEFTAVNIVKMKYEVTYGFEDEEAGGEEKLHHFVASINPFYYHGLVFANSLPCLRVITSYTRTDTHIYDTQFKSHSWHVFKMILNCHFSFIPSMICPVDVLRVQVFSSQVLKAIPLFFVMGNEKWIFYRLVLTSRNCSKVNFYLGKI